MAFKKTADAQLTKEQIKSLVLVTAPLIRAKSPTGWAMDFPLTDGLSTDLNEHQEFYRLFENNPTQNNPNIEALWRPLQQAAALSKDSINPFFKAVLGQAILGDNESWPEFDEDANEHLVKLMTVIGPFVTPQNIKGILQAIVASGGNLTSDETVRPILQAAGFAAADQFVVGDIGQIAAKKDEWEALVGFLSPMMPDMKPDEKAAVFQVIHEKAADVSTNDNVKAILAAAGVPAGAQFTAGNLTAFQKKKETWQALYHILKPLLTDADKLAVFQKIQEKAGDIDAGIPDILKELAIKNGDFWGKFDKDVIINLAKIDPAQLEPLKRLLQLAAILVTDKNVDGVIDLFKKANRHTQFNEGSVYQSILKAMDCPEGFERGDSLLEKLSKLTNKDNFLALLRVVRNFNLSSSRFQAALLTLLDGKDENYTFTDETDLQALFAAALEMEANDLNWLTQDQIKAIGDKDDPGQMRRAFIHYLINEIGVPLKDLMNREIWALLKEDPKENDYLKNLIEKLPPEYWFESVLRGAAIADVKTLLAHLNQHKPAMPITQRKLLLKAVEPHQDQKQKEEFYKKINAHDAKYDTRAQLNALLSVLKPDQSKSISLDGAPDDKLTYNESLQRAIAALLQCRRVDKTYSVSKNLRSVAEKSQTRFETTKYGKDFFHWIGANDIENDQLLKALGHRFDGNVSDGFTPKEGELAGFGDSGSKDEDKILVDKVKIYTQGGGCDLNDVLPEKNEITRYEFDLHVKNEPQPGAPQQPPASKVIISTQDDAASGHKKGDVHFNDATLEALIKMMRLVSLRGFKKLNFFELSPDRQDGLDIGNERASVRTRALAAGLIAGCRSFANIDIELPKDIKEIKQAHTDTYVDALLQSSNVGNDSINEQKKAVWKTINDYQITLGQTAVQYEEGTAVLRMMH